MLSRSATQRAALAWALASWLVASTVLAEDAVQKVRLAWVRSEGAESCPDEDELEKRVRERLGRDPFDKAAKLSIEGAVERSGDEWRAELQIRSDTSTPVGARKLATTAAECGAIADAVVLAIALTIDPSGAPSAPAAAFPLEPAPSSSGPVLQPTNPLPPPPPTTRVVEPTKDEPHREMSKHGRRAMDVLARGGIAAGILPRLAPFASLAGNYAFEPVRLTAGLFLIPEQETSDRRFAFGLTSGSAGICYDLRLAIHLAANLCAELQLGALHASVVDTEHLVPLSPGDHLWAAGAAGPRLSWMPVTPLRLEAGALGVVPILREAFMIRGQPAPVFQSAPVGAMAYVGVGVGVP